MYNENREMEEDYFHNFDVIIEKSLFTRRQISIIYNKLHRGKIEKKISSGAYYRQVKQCKNKIYSLLYTILLFKALEIIDDKTFMIIETILQQLNSLSPDKKNHVNDPLPSDVIDVIDKIIKKTISI